MYLGLTFQVICNLLLLKSNDISSRMEKVNSGPPISSTSVFEKLFENQPVNEDLEGTLAISF